MRKLLTVSFCLCIAIVFSLATANASTVAAQKEWTILVFINGNNNLDKYGAEDINEMETVGSTEKVNVVVQWASLRNRTVQRLLVTKDDQPTRVTSPILKDLGSVDMGDWQSLVEFVQWGVENFPAEKYFIDIWNHGSGWDRIKNGFHAQDISFDDITGNAITTKQLGQALDASAKIIGHKVDIYGSDACLMGMLEVAGEVADSVGVFVGSEETEPLKGWPYDSFLSAWNVLEDATPVNVAKALVESYVPSYQGGAQGNKQVTLSAFDLSKIDGVYSSIKDLSERIRNLSAAERAKVLDAATRTESFEISDNKDFLDFLDLLSAEGIESLRLEDLAETKETIKGFIVANGVTDNYVRAQGAAVWLPTWKWDYHPKKTRYSSLVFDQKTQWSLALQAIIGG